MAGFLIAASEHPTGRLASRLAGLLAGSRGQPETVLHVETQESDDGPQKDQGRKMASDVRQGINRAREARPDEAAEMRNVAVKARAERATVEDVLADEAPKGYDFLMIGLDPAQMPEGGFNPEIAKFARSFDGPLAVAIAHRVHESDPVSGPLKILAPVTGTENTRHSAEVAIELARAARAELTILFLSSGTADAALASRHKKAALKEIAEIAERRDHTVRFRSSASKNRRDAILGAALRERATLIVLGVSVHPSEALLFGQTANRLLEESARSLLFVPR
jgi:nucleotide-binding universal stress UspA family protein